MFGCPVVDASQLYLKVLITGVSTRGQGSLPFWGVGWHPFLRVSVRFSQISTEHVPGVVCIEAVFFNKNVSSCVSTVSVIAVVELAAAHADMRCVQVKPQTVKAATGMGGKASKEQVNRMVNRLLSAEIRNAHEADNDKIAKP